MIPVYKKNIYKNFVTCFLKVCFLFLTIIFIMNLFEEINFFKNSNNKFLIPIFLTLINAPSILFEIFPFIFLISGLYFFLELIEKNELVVYKSYGLTNFSLIKTVGTLSFLIGIFIIVIFYNASANLKFLYLDIKNDYSKDDKYLAVVTGNGLWIRDEINNNTNYINADKLVDNHLQNLTITEFNSEFKLIRVITAKKAEIETNIWKLTDVVISQDNNSERKVQFNFESNFDLNKIQSIFENLSSLNILELHNLKKDYILLGYNTDKLDAYKHKIYAFPFYITLMTCIAAVLMFNTRHKKSKIFHLITGIIISVIIYYINYFFSVIIETQNVPYLISIWGPQIILFMILVSSLIRINEK